ncbi:MAG: single-stranded DNA-binding protein [Planctomycetes bacterium]|nr:single-stranded DNA-binding protein [Planctomycetota bacterium]
MAELNKILLIGRLTKDPELRYTASGMAVAQLRMAVNHTYYKRQGDGPGEKKEEVLYIDVNVWGRSAETVKKYTSKGKELFVEGRLQMQDWTDKQGQKRRDFRVNADNFQFLAGQGSGQGGGRPQQTDEGDQGGPPPDAFDGGGGGGGGGGATRHDGPPSQAQEDDLPF